LEARRRYVFGVIRALCSIVYVGRGLRSLMRGFPFRSSAKALTAMIVAAVAMLTPSSVGYPSSPAASLRAAVFIAPSATDVQPTSNAPSEFEKEKVMSESERIARWSPFIEEASKRFKVSESWIRAVIRMESGGRSWLDDKPITSGAGAMGIMQLMPATYSEMRELYDLGEDPHDPRDNVLAGTAYLRWLYEKYGFPKMFAAYNAGPAAVEKRRRLPSETRAYVKGISRILKVKVPAAETASAGPKTVTATLTRPDGSSITIDASMVKSIRPSLPNEFVSGVQTLVTTGEREQGVTEDLKTVASALKRPSS
jgi:soluble lytic murein transglycosylase-like protein